MKLELHILNIFNVKFAEKTTISSGTLYVNRHELQQLIQQDKRLSRVDIELVHPGESCRVVRVFDVTEPRAKMGTGQNFPGVLGRLETTGEGCTRVLRGAAVVTVGCTIEPRSLLIDVSGPGTELGLYGKQQNIVLICHPVPGINHEDYKNAFKVAGLRAAVYLAEAAKDLQADMVEVYSLGPLCEAVKGLENLPRIAYVYQIHDLKQSADRPPSEPVFYGDNVSKMLPTIVHPNEILDGAILRGFFCQGQETYTIQNHPIILELYKRHGSDLCFAGVVITVAQSTEPERERSAAMATKLVKWVLTADGVILTKIGGGAPHVDLAQTCELCEELGVKTTVIVPDMSGDATADGALIFNTPSADAIVNVGDYATSITLPPVQRVVGGPLMFGDERPAEGEIQVYAHLVNGAVSQLGITKWMMREF